MKCIYSSPPPLHWPGQWVSAHQDSSKAIMSAEDYVFWDGQDLVCHRKGQPFFSAMQCYQTVMKRQHDFVLKAVERKGVRPAALLDGTAGWGREALTLALSGVSVTAVEQSLVPVLFMHFAKEHLFPHIPLQIVHQNFLDYAKENIHSSLPCVYLDPLFFDSKNSLSKKSMEFLYEQPESIALSQSQQDRSLKEALCHLSMDTLVIKQYRQAASWIVGKKFVHNEKNTKTFQYDIFYINKKGLELSDLGL